jgi:hypothetical protein
MKVAAAVLCFTMFGCAEIANTGKDETDESVLSDCKSGNATPGKKGFQIRNGKTAGSDDYEFMGMVYAQNMRITMFPPLQITQKSCSGALVCKNVVLTAGHCIAEGELPGKFSFHTGVKPGETPQVNFQTTPKVAEYKVLHKNGEVGRKDIALLRLDRDLKVKPAKIWMKTLPDPEKNTNGPAVRMIGYGATKNEGGKDVAGGTKKIGDMIFQGHMSSADSEETFQMGILHPREGVLGSVSKSTNACSGDSGGAAMVGNRIYGVLAKIMYFKDGKMQPSPNCEESNITLVSVLSRQKNWVTENLESMCSGGLNLDDESPPAEPALVTLSGDGSTTSGDGVSTVGSGPDSPCE